MESHGTWKGSSVHTSTIEGELQLASAICMDVFEEGLPLFLPSPFCLCTKSPVSPLVPSSMKSLMFSRDPSQSPSPTSSLKISQFLRSTSAGSCQSLSSPSVSSALAPCSLISTVDCHPTNLYLQICLGQLPICLHHRIPPPLGLPCPSILLTQLDSSLRLNHCPQSLRLHHGLPGQQLHLSPMSLQFHQGPPGLHCHHGSVCSRLCLGLHLHQLHHRSSSPWFLFPGLHHCSSLLRLHHGPSSWLGSGIQSGSSCS